MEPSQEKSAVETLRAVARDPDSVAKDWKREGGKVVGYRCMYVPDEVIWAAGALPYPLYGTAEPVKLADAYFQPCTCELVRNLFDHALEGRFAFLDGLVLCNTCDVVRHLYDMWDAYVDVRVHVLNNPQKLLDPSNREYFLAELSSYRSMVAEVTGKEVTDTALREAIALRDETRRLLMELSSRREADPPKLAAAEVLDISMAATILPRDRVNDLLRQAIDEVDAREEPEAYGPRILVTGSLLDDPTLLTMIEEEGGVVVADDLCTTSRLSSRLVGASSTGDPLESIYVYLNNLPLCACMHPAEARLEHLLGLVDRFDVEGVIDFTLKYCHPFLYEAATLKEQLEARDVPTTVLEIGHDTSGHGQLRTRIQAFIEMLEDR